MKNYISFCLLALMPSLMSFAHPSSFATLEGYWKNYQNNVTIEVIRTSYGIKTKRTDQSRWYYYDKRRNSEYIDNQGNKLYLSGNSSLVWKSRNGRKSFRFRKLRDRYDNYDRYQDRWDDTRRNRSYNDYDDYDDYYGNRFDDDFAYNNNRLLNRRALRNLEGNWYNERTSRRLYIDARNNHLKVRLRRGWSNFEQRRPGYFVNRRGDSIEILGRNTLKYNTCDTRRSPSYFYKNRYR